MVSHIKPVSQNLIGKIVVVWSLFFILNGTINTVLAANVSQKEGMSLYKDYVVFEATKETANGFIHEQFCAMNFMWNQSIIVSLKLVKYF